MVNSGAYECWWVTSLGIPFTCCDDCHAEGKGSWMVTPQGTHVFVCCGARVAYDDCFDLLVVRIKNRYNE